MRQSAAALFISVMVLQACAPQEEQPAGEREVIADSMEVTLNEHIIDQWYPRVIDSIHGGFLSDFNYQWEPDGPQNKMIVSQGRHVWTTATLAGFYPGQKERFLGISEHGFDFLKNTMWDEEYGGFYELVTREGEVIPEDTTERVLKRAYGNSFAIYGLAAYARESGNEEALELAKKGFQWLEDYSHDPEYGGYFQFLERDGTPLTEGYQGTPPKDQNSSIHLLEALTELYIVWKDDLLKERLEEMLVIVRDTITTDKGYLTLFLSRDWTPFSLRDAADSIREANENLDHVSFGHDIETAYLLMEASEVLYGETDEVTMTKARRMVEHSIDNGWDPNNGGIYDAGYYFDEQEETMTIIRETKVWWAQVEAMNTLLIMADLYPQDERRYFEKFKMSWNYNRDNLFDDEHKGVFREGADITPSVRTRSKAGIWKTPYHTTRAMVNCIKRLQGEEYEE